MNDWRTSAAGFRQEPTGLQENLPVHVFMVRYLLGLRTRSWCNDRAVGSSPSRHPCPPPHNHRTKNFSTSVLGSIALSTYKGTGRHAKPPKLRSDERFGDIRESLLNDSLSFSSRSYLLTVQVESVRQSGALQDSVLASNLKTPCTSASEARPPGIHHSAVNEHFPDSSP